MLATLFFVAYLFGNIAYINSLNSSWIYWYGGFIFITIYALTELMDRNRYALIWEIMRCGFGTWLIIDQGDWFGAAKWLPAAGMVVGAFLVLSLLAATYFSLKHAREDRQQLGAAS